MKGKFPTSGHCPQNDAVKTYFCHPKFFFVALIKSISGIRGTIGGKPGETLSPIDVVKFTAAFGAIISEKKGGKPPAKVVVGRDGRISGDMVGHLVIHTLIGLGIDVVDLGLSTTPTVELAT